MLLEQFWWYWDLKKKNHIIEQFLITMKWSITLNPLVEGERRQRWLQIMCQHGLGICCFAKFSRTSRACGWLTVAFRTFRSLRQIGSSRSGSVFVHSSRLGSSNRQPPRRWWSPCDQTRPFRQIQCAVAIPNRTRRTVGCGWTARGLSSPSEMKTVQVVPCKSHAAIILQPGSAIKRIDNKKKQNPALLSLLQPASIISRLAESKVRTQEALVLA